MMTVSDSSSVVDDDTTLAVSQLPPGAHGLFLASRPAGIVPSAWGSERTLGLGGGVSHSAAPGQVLSGGVAGYFELVLDLSRTPTPTGLVQVAAGQIWEFQAWHRGSGGGQATSNSTDAVPVTFE